MMLNLAHVKETAPPRRISHLWHVLLIESGLHDKWMTENSEYSPGRAIIHGMESVEPVPKRSVFAKSRIPRLVEAADDLSDKSKSPRRQPLLSAFYDDLRASFELSRLSDDSPGFIKITPRTFDVCWTRNSPGDYFPLWGNVKIKEKELELVMVEDCELHSLVQAVRLGIMDGFPLSDSSVYYCFDDDMIYYYPTESYYTGPCRLHFSVYSFRRFGDLVAEFV